MVNVGRNQLCPCGSGRRHKHCHGRLDACTGIETAHQGFFVPDEVLGALRASKLEQKRLSQEHGDIRETISAEVNGTRFVAAGKSVHFGPGWRTFHDFLNSYLAGLLGKEWGDRQVLLPLAEQHPIVQWHTLSALAMQGAQTDDRGLYVSTIGAANAWLRLGYDLYLLEHNAELQKRLIRRLREPASFQGARFEAAVAAMMLTSGYDLVFSDEKGPGKHPEFIATPRAGSEMLAVEAKSRHRPGILGFDPLSPAAAPESYGVERLLLDAVEKDPRQPLLVFVELNVPRYFRSEESGALKRELRETWSALQRRIWSGGFPCIGVVFYNDVAPWFLDRPLADGAHIWVATFAPERSRHGFEVQSLLGRIVQGCMQRANVPLDFPS